jgi:colanic acid biosynthesis glycosyl transferase WcaI
MNSQVYIFYHYMPPDDVVSSVHFGDLCLGLAARGWKVSAYPSVRGCRDDKMRFPKCEDWHGVSIQRIWRPRFRQSSSIGRFINAIWMIAAWSLLALYPGKAPDIIVIGTDPVLSILVARFWKLIRPGTKVVHWCFDLYPEAAVADGLLPENGFSIRLIRSMLRSAYRSCSLIADLGPCMRRLLMGYTSAAQRDTLVPWALEEPSAPLPDEILERNEVFGDAKLALLYSGNFGRAHSYLDVLELADLLESDGAKLVFSVRGNREAELKAEAQNRRACVRFVDFAPSNKLRVRLACADIHVVTLRPEWTGTVVPSKFFGAISAGRPVLFCGSPDSSVARWISEFNIGWVLAPHNAQMIASAIRDYTRSKEFRTSMRERCWSTYQSHFSKEVQLDRWDMCLSALLDTRGAQQIPSKSLPAIEC